jgi:hypothetical protein
MGFVQSTRKCAVNAWVLLPFTPVINLFGGKLSKKLIEKFIIFRGAFPWK